MLFNFSVFQLKIHFRVDAYFHASISGTPLHPFLVIYYALYDVQRHAIIQAKTNKVCSTLSKKAIVLRQGCVHVRTHKELHLRAWHDVHARLTKHAYLGEPERALRYAVHIHIYISKRTINECLRSKKYSVMM